jgi:hypothetical protein
MDINTFEFGRKIEKMIEDAGFIAETHSIITEDQYKLVIHRIRPPVGFRNNKAVLFLHQMDGSSMDWVMNSVEES